MELLPTRTLLLFFRYQQREKTDDSIGCDHLLWDQNGLEHFEMKNWVQHILTVFSRKNVDQLLLTAEATQINLDDLKENFGRPIILIAERAPSHEYNQLMLQTFLPVDRFETSLQIFENSKIPSEVLTQNFSNLSILNLEYGLNLTLDVLMMAKDKSLHFRELHFAELDFGKFSNRWLHHGENPDLEHLCITNLQCERKNGFTIMRDVQMPLTETRWFKTEGYDNPIQVTGDNDI